MRNNYTHTRRKRIKKVIGIKRGGKVLGKGADGCVLTQYAWPCKSPLDGYDPSDPTVVSKIIQKYDNEDVIIRVASSILQGDDAKFMIQHIGSCIPESPLTSDRHKQHQVLDSLNEIMDMYEVDKTLYNSKKKPHDGCTTIATTPPEDIEKQYKIIVNKKYTSDLLRYVENNLNDPSIVQKIITAAIPLSEILQKLIKTPYNRILNIDLHQQNIFVNLDTHSNIQMGIADFGRCAFMSKDLDTNTNFENWYNEFDNYIMQGDISIRFSQIPFEVRLINYLNLQFNYLQANTSNTNLNLTIDTLFWRKYTNRILSFNNTKYPDPLNLIKDKPTFDALKIYYNNFIDNILDYVEAREELLQKNFTLTDILSHNIELQYMIDFLLERFRTCGFLSTLIAALWNTPEFTTEIPMLERAVAHFIVYNKDTYLFGNTPIHRLVKLYYMELLRPYGGNYKTIQEMMLNEQIYNFPAVFAAEFPFINISEQYVPIAQQSQQQSQQRQPTPQAHSILLNLPGPFKKQKTRKARKSKQ